MNIEISLKGKHIELIPYDEKHIDYLYTNLMNQNIEGFEDCILKEKSDLYRAMDNSNRNIKIFIKNLSNNKISGYISGYNYNKIDGYIYIASILEEKDDLNKEALSLFINYLLKCFPIRKIYCEIYQDNDNKLELFQKEGFVKEATLIEDTFFNGKYYDKYILALNREGWSNE